MARKVNKNLVALSSAAIISIYAAGYSLTQSAADRAAVTVSAQASTPAALASAPQPPSPTSTAITIARAIATASAPATAPATRPPTTTPPAGAAATGTAASAPGYRDGTYTGSGSSRRGDIQVALTIRAGAIASVQITRSTTYYPVSDVARLHDEVLARQGVPIHYISGATESSRAFRGAVVDALNQATSASVPPAPTRPGA